MTDHSLSIIVPIYNEAELLKTAIPTIHRFVTKNFADFEIILVESGSSDGSGDICDQLAHEFNRMSVIHEGARNGFGSALRRGFQQSSKDLVCVITADMPFSLDSLLMALPHLKTSDAVLSYRSKDNRKNFFRKIQSAVYNLVIRLTLRTRVRHVNSAFKIYKRRTLQGMTLISCGWFIDAEIVYWITKNRVRYVEIPVELIERSVGKSTVGLSAPLGILRELARFLRLRNSLKT